MISFISFVTYYIPNISMSLLCSIFGTTIVNRLLQKAINKTKSTSTILYHAQLFSRVWKRLLPKSLNVDSGMYADLHL